METFNLTTTHAWMIYYGNEFFENQFLTIFWRTPLTNSFFYLIEEHQAAILITNHIFLF